MHNFYRQLDYEGNYIFEEMKKVKKRIKLHVYEKYLSILKMNKSLEVLKNLSLLQSFFPFSCFTKYFILAVM